MTKSKYVMTLNSGTSALHLALKSINVGVDTYVIMSPITFVATGNAVKYNNAKIIFVDADPVNYGMCPKALEKALKKIAFIKKDHSIYKKDKKKISCILPTHVFGIPCNISEIKKIADKFKIPLVEDAAEALGSFDKGKHLGLFGKVGILSFNGNKIITTGSGGAIITNNKKIYNKIRHLASVSKKVQYFQAANPLFRTRPPSPAKSMPLVRTLVVLFPVNTSIWNTSSILGPLAPPAPKNIC